MSQENNNAKEKATTTNNNNFKINSNKLIEQRPRSSGFRSFLNWFKKVESLQQRENIEEHQDRGRNLDSDSSEDDSSDSSTDTVASFAFLPANKYKPYGDAEKPEKFFSPGPYTDTYLRLIIERNRRRSMDKNITLRKKYSLYTSGTLPTRVDDDQKVEEEVSAAAPPYDTFSLPTFGKIRAKETENYDRKTASLSTRHVKSHVKGKRKAPQPPIAAADFMKSYRKKRKAPQPPPSKDDNKVTKVPEVTPKPWYKRESKQKNKTATPPSSSADNEKNNSNKNNNNKNKHEFPEVGFFRCSQLFDNIKESQKGEKRISRFLPNISELDREAAEIIKQHKMNSENSNGPIWLSNVNSPPSATKELISKFNALATPNVNNNNNEIKLDNEMIKSNIIKSPKLGNHSKLNKTSDGEQSPMLKNRALLSPKFPREGEISQSFKAEIFSAIPGLSAPATQSSNQANYGKATEQDLEKLSYMEEKIKLKEMLKEMRNSLPKRPKPQQRSKESDADDIQTFPKEEIAQDKNDDARSSKLEAKPSVFKRIQENCKKNEAGKSAAKQNQSPLLSNKVSSFAQTNCVLQNTSDLTNKLYNDVSSNGLYSNVNETVSKDKVIQPQVANNEDNVKKNTVVLLKRLEQAIADGDDVTAANLAKDLAMLKVNCLVTCSPHHDRERRYKRVKIYIEDQFSHQGPLPLQVPENATIGELKKKVETELNIPVPTQRWIIGKKLAANDAEKITQYNDNNFEIPLFLYVIAIDKKLQKTNAETKQNEEENIKNIAKPNTKITNDKPSSSSTKEVSGDLNNVKKNYLFYDPVTGNPQLRNVTKNTWICADCTLINSLLSPLCSACGKRPEFVETKQNNDTPSNFDNHYKQLLNLDSKDLIFNVETLDCPICFQNCKPMMGITLRDCLHSFCRECLVNTIKFSEEAELKCPYRDIIYSCDSIIQEREIRALVDKTTYEKHLAKSVKFAENKIQNTFHCKTPDCKGWCIFDDNVNEFLCPACKKNNCLTCQVIHEGKNCKQYQEQINKSSIGNEGQQTKHMLDEMVKKGDALACPSCHVIMVKKWGCDWVRCSMCKTEICWVTRGPRWGPSGKGDTSAGCQCGVNGVKCHPKCNYCH